MRVERRAEPAVRASGHPGAPRVRAAEHVAELRRSRLEERRLVRKQRAPVFSALRGLVNDERTGHRE